MSSISIGVFALLLFRIYMALLTHTSSTDISGCPQPLGTLIRFQLVIIVSTRLVTKSGKETRLGNPKLTSFKASAIMSDDLFLL